MCQQNKKAITVLRDIIWDVDNISLKDAIEGLKEYANKYGESATLFVDGNGELTLEYERLETDEEYEARILNEKMREDHLKKWNKTNEEKERELYEILKKKYGDK